jgi:hypothetical protein
MQRKYERYNVENRTVYYACRAISRQIVDEEHRYNSLKSITVSFIMSDYNIDRARKDEIVKKNLKGMNHIILYNESNQKRFSDLIDIYEVFVPSLIENDNYENENLKVFMEFFAINTQEKANIFLSTYEGNSLARKLITAYNIAVENEIPQEGVNYMENRDKMSVAEIEADYIEQGIRKGMAKGMAQGRAQGMAQGMAKGIEEGMKKGMAKGIKEGMKKGIVEGRAEGKNEAIESTIRAYLEDDLPLDRICKYTSMTKTELFDFCYQHNIDLLGLGDQTHNFEKE